MKIGWSVFAVWIGLMTMGIVQAGETADPTLVSDPVSVQFPGADAERTLDDGIQHVVEQALNAAMTNYHPEAVWAIVEKVSTGEILAMASRSANGGSDAGGSPQSASANPAVGSSFEPGSLFSIGIIAAAINEGLISTNDLFDCENGEWSYNGNPLKDFHPYGTLDVTDILRKSSGIGTAKIAVMMNEERLQRYLTDFGLGKPTGVETTDENPGLLRPASEWGKTGIARVAMGHTIAVTALQMLNMMCCIGNDGSLMKPHLVRKVVGKDGKILLENRPEVVARPISASTAKLMRSMLVEVTREGGDRHSGGNQGLQRGGQNGYGPENQGWAVYGE